MLEDAVNYNITKGLIGMLIYLSSDPEKVVWSKLAEATQVCVERMKSKKMRESWRWFEYEKTGIKMKVKVRKHGSLEVPLYSANIKLDTDSQDVFTSKQVYDFLIEEVLLGDKDDI